MRLNWKLVAALAAAGLAVDVFAPRLAAYALPVLIVSACLLSMLLMMRAMGTTGSGKRTDEPSDSDEVPGQRTEVAALRADPQDR